MPDPGQDSEPNPNNSWNDIIGTIEQLWAVTDITVLYQCSSS